MVSCCTNAETDNSCCRSPVILPNAEDALKSADQPAILGTALLHAESSQHFKCAGKRDGSALLPDRQGREEKGNQAILAPRQPTTIFFGSDMQLEKAAAVHHARFNFMNEARIWYSRDPGRQNLPGDCQNMIVLSEEFYREIQAHPIPADLEAAKVLSSSPAVLDLYMWLSYRCFAAGGEERVPLFGDFGLVNQLGSATYARPHPPSEVPRAIGKVVGPGAHDVAGMPGVHQSGRSSDHRQARACHSACGEQPCLCLRSTTGCLCGKRPWPKLTESFRSDWAVRG